MEEFPGGIIAVNFHVEIFLFTDIFIGSRRARQIIDLAKTLLLNRQRTAAKPRRSGLLKIVVVLLAASPLVTAQAGIPPLRYQFSTNDFHNAQRLVTFEVGSRAEACTTLPPYFPDPPYGLNGGTVKPGWDTPQRFGGETALILCLYSSIYSDPDERSPGYAFCTRAANGSGYIVDKTTETCVCGAGTAYFADVDACVAKTEITGASTPPGNPANNGCPDCPVKKYQPRIGEPIEPSTGNMWHVMGDYAPASPTVNVTLVRTYNSSPYNWDGALTRSFGTRWTQPYDVALQAEAPIAPGGPGKCWRREDTKYVWCDGPLLPVPRAIPDAVSIVRGDGKKYYFKNNGGTWTSNGNTADRLSATFDSNATAVVDWTYVTSQGDSTERFSADGKLLSITSRNGAAQRITYSDGTTNDSSIARFPADAPVCANVQAGAVLPAGRRMCVTDQWGHQLQFEYNQLGRIVKAIGPAGQTYLYEYDGPSGGCTTWDAANPGCTANNLTKVTYPGGASQTYYYNEAAQINGGSACAGMFPIGGGFGHLLNSMTGLVDENGVRHISWTYDCFGLATSSQLGAGTNKVRLGYGALGSVSTTVTHDVGLPSASQQTVAGFMKTTINGVANNYLVQSRCVECGDYSERLYDTSGNVISLKDFKGNYTCFAYDTGRQLQTVRVEGGGSYSCSTMLAATTLPGLGRKTSTQWHATFALPVAIAEPKKRTTFTYDALGNLLTRTEQATSDLTGVQGVTAPLIGAPRTWTYTVNSLGQVLTATGPRTDVNDTTSYTYDSEGNLTSATNAANQVTALSNYDANGRVGRIVSPNDMVTEIGYTPRGWVSWRSTSAGGVTETTSFSYDNVGQVTGVALPGGATLTYTYDDSHRLTSIRDGLGNSITYALDLTGNRVQEQVKDASNALKRNISRAFDTLNLLKQQTGGAQ